MCGPVKATMADWAGLWIIVFILIVSICFSALTKQKPKGWSAMWGIAVVVVNGFQKYLNKMKDHMGII